MPKGPARLNGFHPGSGTLNSRERFRPTVSAVPRDDVEVESTVDIEPTHLVFEVFVRNRTGAPIRNVTIRPEVRRGDFHPEVDAKGIADLPEGHSGRAVFALEPRGPAQDVIDVSAAVAYVDSQGARHRRDAPRVLLGLALPALRPASLERDAFADRASGAFSHPFEFPAPAPPDVAVRSSVEALAALSLAAVEQAMSSSGPPATRASLVGLDARGTSYMVRIVAAPRGNGSVVRVTVFAESEAGLFALHHRVREVVEGSLRPSP